ncbi:EAL domain-containing protein [Chitinimonas lacunae]|uniref:EAL domain-containing protein n=1 Tax=Chitinimonas lacunae TaxID=1963018 RepID=A0ABV8MPK1_9NEIS
MNTELRILLLEDVATDAELTALALSEGGLQFALRRASGAADYVAALSDFRPDVILADYTLPGFDGLTALTLRDRLSPDVPFIFVTGSLGEERAIEALKAGATDYILKDRLARLPAAVERAISERDARREKSAIAGALDAERRFLEAVLATCNALIVALDGQGRLLRVNRSALTALGETDAHILGRYYWEVFAPQEDIDMTRCMYQRFLDRNNPVLTQRPWRARLPSGQVVLWSASLLASPGADGCEAILAGIDVTDQEAAEQRAYVLKHYDILTGLPNRELLLQQLQRRSTQSDPLNHIQALLLIGLDRLQHARDSLDVDSGDVLLIEAARRLRGWQPDDMRLARVSDASFALLLEVADEKDLSEHVQRILDHLRQPYSIAGQQLSLPAYIGVTLLPNEAADTAALLQTAEAALHQAINEQNKSYELYTPRLSSQARERLALESDLRMALNQGTQLELFYQPQIDLANGRMTGVESLIRWRHPLHGLLSPARFISLAEQSGLISPLGDWVLQTACLQGLSWERAGLPPITIAVNLSARQFNEPRLMATVQAVLEASGLDPHRLELELTESATMQDPEKTIAILRQLRELGIQVAIDDFGTGYSNFNYLKRFPVDKLKLDQSFVSELTADPDDLAISRAVIAMAHQLRLGVVAEGVETEGQLALLAAAGCDTIQGYYVGRPMPAVDLTQLLQNGVNLPPEKRRGYSRTLLFVDDEINTLSAMRRLLRSTGYQLLAANSARQAFELLATHEVGVILADQRMPELNGTEFLNRVKDMYPDTIRMVLSGYTDLRSITEAINRGAIYKFLTKPWDDEELLKALAEAFDKFEADRSRRAPIGAEMARQWNPTALAAAAIDPPPPSSSR